MKKRLLIFGIASLLLAGCGSGNTTHSENIGKHLALNGTKLTLANELDDDLIVFEVTINSDTGDYFMVAGNGNYVSMNVDSYKFVAQYTTGYDIEIYRKITA